MEPENTDVDFDFDGNVDNTTVPEALEDTFTLLKSRLATNNLSTFRY